MGSNANTRTRIAPAPTGFFHIGSARTSLFNYLFAKKNNGKFVLRIDDTDLVRSEDKYSKDIKESLQWLGYAWDEEFNQSERIDIYEPYLKQLLDSGDAFYCDHTKEELELEQKAQAAQKLPPKHVCDRKGRAESGIIRFRCPDEKIKYTDLIKGDLEFDGRLLGDISIAKNPKTPLYNFASVVDDSLMKISHVIRGEDHISNTPKQLFILKALKLEAPEFGHLPLILGTDKTKLSKRHGATAVSDYKKQGYLPEALNNFLVFLGWHPGTERELFSLDELINEFSLENMNKSNAIFNVDKLDWFNGQYIRKMDLDSLTNLCLAYLPEETDFDFARKVVALEQERIKKISEIGELTKFFFEAKIKYDKDLLIWKKMTMDQVKQNLTVLLKKLEKIEDFSQARLEGTIMPLAQKQGAGELLWPLRVALSGQKASPGPFEIMAVIGKEKTLDRVKQAISRI